MSGWKSTDAQANNKPSYIAHIGLDQNSTNTYNSNVILITDSRLANGNSAYGVVNTGLTANNKGQIAHAGWVHMTHGTGPLVSVSVANVASLVYTNEYLTISGANGANANALMTVANSNVISFVVNSGGAGYIFAPTVTAVNANNSTLVFTAKTGGRSNRVKSEVLVALSQMSSANANAALPWFTGV